MIRKRKCPGNSTHTLEGESEHDEGDAQKDCGCRKVEEGAVCWVRNEDERQDLSCRSQKTSQGLQKSQFHKINTIILGSDKKKAK